MSGATWLPCETYDLNGVAAEVGCITTSQVEIWISRGYYTPENKVPPGVKRAFTPIDCVKLSILADLAADGFTVADAGEIVRNHQASIRLGINFEVSRRCATVAVDVSARFSRFVLSALSKAA